MYYHLVGGPWTNHGGAIGDLCTTISWVAHGQPTGQWHKVMGDHERPMGDPWVTHGLLSLTHGRAVRGPWATTTKSSVIHE